MAKRGKGGNRMRLICPNCGAQYEVDVSVIPESGRDVQCSACGHTWFQPSRAMIEAAEEAERTAADEPAEWEVEAEAVEAPAVEAEDVATAEEGWSVAAAEPAPPEPAPEAEEIEIEVEPEIALRAAAEVPAELEADFEPDFEEDFEVPVAEPEAEPLTEPAPESARALEEPEEPAPEEPVVAAPEPATDLSEAIATMMAETAPPATPPGPPAEEPPEFDPLAPAPAAGAVPRRTLDDSLLAILREEAEREAAARRAEGSTLETQEEMNLEPDSAAAAANRAAAKLASSAPASPPRSPKLDFSDLNEPDSDEELVVDLTGGEDESAGAHGPSRRQMLPDIEEINSTLRASADRGSDAAAIGTPQARAQQRSGFRFGFTLVLVLALIALLLYALAPRIGAAVPVLAPILDAYVAAVNDGRVWLDGQLRAVIDQVQGPARPLS